MFPVLIDEHTIDTRIRELATAMQPHFDGEPPVLVAVVEGARTFARRLARRLPGEPPVHEIRASSYGAGTVSRGEVEIETLGPLPIEQRQVLLIEDIVDTGRTVARVAEQLRARGATEVITASLLSKPERRVVDVAIHYLGFEIEDRFVIGFGMDVAGRYRELPHIAIYDEEIAARALKAAAD